MRDCQLTPHCRKTELDALLFAHLAVIRRALLPVNRLDDSLAKFPNLVDYTERIYNVFFHA